MGAASGVVLSVLLFILGVTVTREGLDLDRERRALKATITCLEEDAEREAQKFEAYRNGDDL